MNLVLHNELIDTVLFVYIHESFQKKILVGGNQWQRASLWAWFNSGY